MIFVKWKEEYSVGVATIDQQHQQLFKHINDFYNSLKSGADKKNMKKVIGELEDYIHTHFSTEEALMQSASYPDFVQHKLKHDEFCKKVADFRERFEAGRLLLTIEVAGFIKDWITSHILDTDQLYKGIVTE